MADRNVVLDTSAVIALRCDEYGADTVEGYLNKAKKGGNSNYGSVGLPDLSFRAKRGISMHNH